MKPTKEKTKEMFQREKFLSIVLENMDFFFFLPYDKGNLDFYPFSWSKIHKTNEGRLYGNLKIKKGNTIIAFTVRSKI